MKKITVFSKDPNRVKYSDCQNLDLIWCSDTYTKMPAKIRIQSSDGEIFKVELEVAKKSKTIRTMLEDLGIETTSEEEEIKEILPLPNVNAMILKKVIDWCEHHKNEPEPPEEEPDRRNGERIQRQIYDLEEWDAEFVKVDKGIIFEIIIAANYLHIQGLIDMTCMTVAKMLKGKTPEQIREEFNIVNDFTPNPGFEDDPFFADSEWKKKNRKET